MHRIDTCLGWLLGSVLAAGAVECAGAQCLYDPTEIDSRTGNVEGRAINEQGHVAGTDGANAFIWKDGLLTTLPRPPWISSVSGTDGMDIADVGGLDDRGMITGTCHDHTPPLTGHFRAYVHDGESYIILPALQNNSWTYSTGINNDLVVVGYTTLLDISALVAVKWQNGTIVPIEGLAGPNSKAVDINDNGVILGWTGQGTPYDADVFIADANGVNIIGKPPGAYSASPSAINDLGDIVGHGFYSTDDPPGFIRRGFLWSNGQWMPIGPQAPDPNESFPRDINNGRQVIGYLEPNGDFIWQNGQIAFLDDLVVPAGPPFSSSVWAINDVGQIAGGGSGGVGMLLTPMPGPQGDLNADCHVTSFDLAMLLAAWGPCGGCAADLTGDGVVGPADLSNLLANWGALPPPVPCGDSKAGSCFKEHPTPACSNSECCDAVCSVDSFCCQQDWDSFCVQQAFVLCGGCGTNPAGSCFEVHAATGCDMSECCLAVCSEIPSCCATAWDQPCVDLAYALCAPCGAPQAGSCFDCLGTPGCNDKECCDAVCRIDSFCCEALWDCICASEAERFCSGSP